MWLIQQFDSLLHLGDCKEYPTMAKAKTPRNSTNTNGGSAESQVTAAAQPETKSEVRAVKKSLSEVRKNLVPINLDEEIRRRAYELWEQRGYESGHEDEHWRLAETEILSRYNQRQQSA
jgi:hypothetical protein